MATINKRKVRKRILELGERKPHIVQEGRALKHLLNEANLATGTSSVVMRNRATLISVLEDLEREGVLELVKRGTVYNEIHFNKEALRGHTASRDNTFDTSTHKAMEMHTVQTPLDIPAKPLPLVAYQTATGENEHPGAVAEALNSALNKVPPRDTPHDEKPQTEYKAEAKAPAAADADSVAMGIVETLTEAAERMKASYKKQLADMQADYEKQLEDRKREYTEQYRLRNEAEKKFEKLDKDYRKVVSELADANGKVLEAHQAAAAAQEEAEQLASRNAELSEQNAALREQSSVATLAERIRGVFLDS